MPYCVGTKKGFVVTWLTKTKFQVGCVGKLPSVVDDELVEADEAEVEFPLHAANSAEMDRPPAPSSRNLRRPMGERREKRSDSFIVGTLQFVFMHRLN